jgi:hypothetical protein
MFRPGRSVRIDRGFFRHAEHAEVVHSGITRRRIRRHANAAQCRRRRTDDAHCIHRDLALQGIGHLLNWRLEPDGIRLVRYLSAPGICFYAPLPQSSTCLLEPSRRRANTIIAREDPSMPRARQK